MAFSFHSPQWVDIQKSRKHGPLISSELESVVEGEIISKVIELEVEQIARLNEVLAEFENSRRHSTSRLNAGIYAVIASVVLGCIYFEHWR